jgi:hypothetical protein
MDGCQGERSAGDEHSASGGKTEAANRLRSALHRLCGGGGGGAGGQDRISWLYINHLGWCRCTLISAVHVSCVPYAANITAFVLHGAFYRHESLGNLKAHTLHTTFYTHYSTVFSPRAQCTSYQQTHTHTRTHAHTHIHAHAHMNTHPPWTICVRRGPFTGSKVIHAHLCGRLPRNTLLVGYEPGIASGMLSQNLDVWFRCVTGRVSRHHLCFPYPPQSPGGCGGICPRALPTLL